MNARSQVAVYRVCEALGIDTEGQRKKLKELQWARTTMIVARDKLGKKKEVFAIDLKSLPMWLAGAMMLGLSLGGCAVHAAATYPPPPPGFYYAEPCPGGWCYHRPGSPSRVVMLSERRTFIESVPVRPMPPRHRHRHAPHPSTPRRLRP